MNKDIRFFHIRAAGGAAITVYTRRIAGDLIETGLAFCSPQDQYDKDIGRRISSYKGIMNPMIFEGTHSKDVVKREIGAILDSVSCRKHSGVPSWVPTADSGQWGGWFK